MHKTLVWFRQDLRVKDNPALAFAHEKGSVLPVYIYDDAVSDAPELGGASKWWLHQSLHTLRASLDNQLVVLKGDPKELIPKLVNAYNIDTVVWNRCYEPQHIQRDKRIKAMLGEADVTAKSFNGHLLWEPMTVLKQDGSPYKVFTPYYRKGCLNAPAPRYPIAAPEGMTFVDASPSDQGVDALELMPVINWYSHMASTWQPGEQGASERLKTFLEQAALEYDSQRNIPAVTGTSMLSPHLHWGEISPNQIWYATLDKHDSEQKGVDTFMSELGWREFSYYLLYHFPALQTDNFSAKFNPFPWREDDQALQAWQRGQTGIPIVDAGMRELWQTGYMHNRVRMVVGSFLVKNLLVDWRKGEQWFWDCLCDADMASNSASWQWVAGCGADAAPYFRVFNPVLQGEKFDKQGEYVKRYCPELTQLPAKFIHKPWEAPANILEYAKVKLGENYPSPIVDLKLSRQRALDAFASIKQAPNA